MSKTKASWLSTTAMTYTLSLPLASAHRPARVEFVCSEQPNLDKVRPGYGLHIYNGVMSKII